MENTVINENKDFNRFAIPVKWGVLLGIGSCLVSTMTYKFLIGNYIMFMVSAAIIFLLTIVLYGVAGAQQRKAMGGYINIKEAFQAIFVVILISSIITTIYGIIYAKFIDPDLMDKIKAGTLSFMERMKAPPEKIDETAKDFDSRVADSLKPGQLIYAFAKSLVISSIFGFICAAIIKKKKPLLG